jgi:hypothetical protein
MDSKATLILYEFVVSQIVIKFQRQALKTINKQNTHTNLDFKLISYFRRKLLYTKIKVFFTHNIKTEQVDSVLNY